MAGFQDVIYFMVAGFNLIAISIIGVAFMQSGLFMPFFKAKASRGKKLIVRVLHPVQSYFVTGLLDEGFLVFRDREKNDRRIMYSPGCIDRAAGVYWTAVDDEKNCMIQRMDGLAVAGFDAVKYDELYKRALYKPNVMNEVLLKIAIIMIAVGLLIIIVVAILSFRNGQIAAQSVEIASQTLAILSKNAAVNAANVVP